LTHQNQTRPELSTLRFNCIAAGSRIDNNAAGRELKMSVLVKRRQEYDSLFANINKDILSLHVTG